MQFHRTLTQIYINPVIVESSFLFQMKYKIYIFIQIFAKVAQKLHETLESDLDKGYRAFNVHSAWPTQ